MNQTIPNMKSPQVKRKHRTENLDMFSTSKSTIGIGVQVSLQAVAKSPQT